MLQLSDKDLNFTEHMADMVRRVGNQIQLMQRHKNLITLCTAPVRASKRVKSPTLQGKQNRLPLEINRIGYLWKQVLQNFQSLRILVQLFFAPRFKQRHISRYNYIKRQQQKNPRGIDKSNDPSTQLTCRIKELRNPFVSDR